MLIDTHCHLDAVEFDADRGAVYNRAVRQGVTTLIVPAVERANFGAVASVCRSYNACKAAYGIHPLFVSRAREEDLMALRALLKENPAVAIGEIGLDHFVEPRDEALQEYYFIEQLRIACEFDLPVLLHVRRAVDAVLKQLRRYPVRGGIAHAYNGSRQQADEFIRLGFKLGFGGAMSFPRALKIRALAATLPQESIVLETDAPDISPVWKIDQTHQTHQRNEPGELPRIATVLAELRACSPEEVAHFTTLNARAVFSI